MLCTDSESQISQSLMEGVGRDLVVSGPQDLLAAIAYVPH